MMDYKIHGRNALKCTGDSCGKEEPEFTAERDATLRHWELSRFKVVHAPNEGCYQSWWRALIPDSVWRDERFQDWINQRRGAQEAIRANP